MRTLKSVPPVRPFSRCLLFLLLLVTFALAPGTALAGKDYRAERFDVDLTIFPGGVLDVTETIRFRFEGGPFTYVFRELSLHETDGINNISASIDGKTLPSGDQPGQVEIIPGDPIQVRWHFEPLSDSTHTFQLRYQAGGVIRQTPQGDTLIWKAVPEEHEYEIDSSTVRFHYPAGVAPVSIPELNVTPVQTTQEGNQISLVAGPLSSDIVLTITAQFPEGSLGAPVPKWQALEAERDRQVQRVLPFGLGAALGGLVVGLIFLQLIGVRTVLDRQDMIYPVSDLASPPQDLPPAIAGMLASGTSKPAWNHALATLFDLARRGVIRIEEQKPANRWFGRDFILTHQPADEILRPHERGLIELIFHTRKGIRERVKITELRSNLDHNWKRFSNPLQEEMEAMGYVDPDRLASRQKWMGFSILLTGLASLVTVTALVVFGAFLRSAVWVWLLPAALLVGGSIALFILGLLGIVVVGLYSPYTLHGDQSSAQWKGFARHLRAGARGADVYLRPDLFETYLIFAAGIGYAETWIKFFHQRGDVPIPTWFHAVASQQPGGDWGAFAAMVSSTSSAGGADGSGGGSGGGASGAG